MVELSGSQASGIDSFGFLKDNQAYFVGAFIDPNGTREMALVWAGAPEYLWLSPPSGPLPWIPGIMLSQVGQTFIVSFTDVELSSNGVDPVIILNGELRVNMR